MRKGSTWIMIFVILAGIVIGGFLGELLAGNNGLQWLNYGLKFGINPPFSLNLYIATFTFGMGINLTISSIIGVLIALGIYKIMVK